jgi:hypothetical protein
MKQAVAPADAHGLPHARKIMNRSGAVNQFYSIQEMTDKLSVEVDYRAMGVREKMLTVDSFAKAEVPHMPSAADIFNFVNMNSVGIT